MPIQIKPLGSNPRVLVYRFSGSLTLEDIETLYTAEDPFYATGQWLGLILDLTELHTVAATLFPHLMQMRIVSDRQVVAGAVVGANPYLRAIFISLGLAVSQREFVFCATMDEALGALIKYTELHLAAPD